MKIVLITAEAVPFAQTGGLAQVTASLPASLVALGHDVAVMLPLYRCARQSGVAIRDTGLRIQVPVAERVVAGEIWQSHLPGSRVPVYLIAAPDYYDRDRIYGPPGAEYPDNCERFGFFCRASIEATRLLDLRPDVLHLHDWHTAMVAAYMRLLYRDNPLVGRAATLLTIHNMKYQGRFWSGNMPVLGLDWRHFNWRELEFHGDLCFLKAGIVYADLLNTVSERYAREIQSEPFGCGLSGVLLERQADLFGVVNGVDYRVWTPETDPHLAARYSAKDLGGKAACKRALQRECGLAEDADAPLAGMVVRLEEEKGVDLVVRAFPDLMARRLQFVLLGTGQEQYHTLFAGLAKQYPKQAHVVLRFDDALAHRIQAGADVFLMPSVFEPCGLSQLCALRYGAVPVVHETGGLADTVVDASPERLANGSATGFVFSPHNEEALLRAVDRALALFRKPAGWRNLMASGMGRDWSWSASARRYVGLYERAASRRREE